MSILLRTNNPKQVFKLSAVKGNEFTLHVSSGNFSANHMYSHYETNWLSDFLSALKQMEEGSLKEVLLDDCEDNSLSFELDNLGHLTVKGRMVEHNQIEQELIFGFITDQTCLKPFINDLAKALTDSSS